jgi:3'-5' exoribonuclease
MTQRSDARMQNGRNNLRSFCGGRFPWPLIVELSDGDDVLACYLVHEKRRAETRNNKPYLKLTLGDRSGRIDGYVWDDADRWDPLCEAEEVVGVRGRIGSYQDRLQLRVQTIEPLHVEDTDLEYLLPASPRSCTEMERELDALVTSIRDAPLRALLQRCLGRSTELGRSFRVHPAAKRNHHAYLSGLLEHSLSVAGVCDRLVEHYQGQGVSLDRDLLVAGALLHDIGKIRELRGFPAPGYTDAGKLLGHIVIGIQMVGKQAEEVSDLPPERLLLLQHLIASHQGKPEWDSPRVPQLREALVLHYADDLDAKMNQVGGLLEGVTAGEWTSYDRSMGRSFFQPPSIRASDEVEPVPAEEAMDVFMDLFRS